MISIFVPVFITPCDTEWQDQEQNAFLNDSAAFLPCGCQVWDIVCQELEENKIQEFNSL